MRSRGAFYTLLYVVLFFSCNNKKEVTSYVVSEDLHSSMQHLTDVIVHDIFSPPVASRIYAYASIAPYEVLALKDSSYLSLADQLTDLSPIPLPENEISYEVAALNAHYLVAKQLIFSEQKIESHRQEWLRKVKNYGISRAQLQNSLAYSEEVARHIIRWSSFDNYKETRTFQKYTISNAPHRWQPTPPAYMEAIEPHWSKIRPFVIDSATQFFAGEPTAFSMEKGSDFYKEVMEVYETSKSLDQEKSEIASFWDCNPYVMNVHGHVMFATKKITPGGHWMGIAKIASQITNADIMKTSAAYALTSIALADGFISCWDEKYRSNLIRPETVINRYIDEEWQPLLQTPPFPEYTSGHSVISNAAAAALTSAFGEPFAFTDSTEVKYGLPARKFNSFQQAADEAAISRLYGGIHYMPAIVNGAKQGQRLGEFVVNNLKLENRSE